MSSIPAGRRYKRKILNKRGFVAIALVTGLALSACGGSGQTSGNNVAGTTASGPSGGVVSRSSENPTEVAVTSAVANEGQSVIPRASSRSAGATDIASPTTEPATSGTKIASVQGSGSRTATSEPTVAAAPSAAPASVMPTPTQKGMDRSAPAAVVNGQPISFEELDQLLETRYGQDALQQLIVQKLIDQEAEKRHIKVTDAEIDKRMKEAQGAYIDRNQARADLELEKMLKPEVKISDQDLNDYYKANQQQFSTPQEVKLDRVIVEKLDDANKASDALRKGEDIESVVQKYGVKQGKEADLNGVTDFVPIEQLNPAIVQTVLQMAKGEVAGPIQVGNEYEVIRIVDRRGGETKPFDQVKDEVRNSVEQKKLQEMAGPFIRKLLSQAKIKSQFGPVPTIPAEPQQPPPPQQPPSGGDQPVG